MPLPDVMKGTLTQLSLRLILPTHRLTSLNLLTGRGRSVFSSTKTRVRKRIKMSGTIRILYHLLCSLFTEMTTPKRWSLKTTLQSELIRWTSTIREKIPSTMIATSWVWVEFLIQRWIPFHHRSQTGKWSLELKSIRRSRTVKKSLTKLLKRKLHFKTKSHLLNHLKATAVQDRK